MNYKELLEVLYSFLVIEGIFLSVFGAFMILIVAWNASKAKMKRDNKEPYKVREQEESPNKDVLNRKVDEEMALHPDPRVRAIHKLYSANQVRELAIVNCISDASSKKKLPMMIELVKVYDDENYRDLLYRETSLTKLKEKAKRLGIDSKQDRESLVKAIQTTNQEKFDELFKNIPLENPADTFSLDNKENENIDDSQLPEA